MKKPWTRCVDLSGLKHFQNATRRQIKMAEEMNRKVQGSMQLQGEVQELAIEEFLKQTFLKVEVEEIIV